MEAPGGFYDEQLANRLVEYLFTPRNSLDPEVAYRMFRGRDAQIDALMRARVLRNQTNRFDLLEKSHIDSVVTIAHIIALIGPGPDFIVACRNAIQYSRKIGLWTAVGFGIGVCVHVSYAFFWIDLGNISV